MIRRRLKIISFILAVMFIIACQTPSLQVRNSDGETTPRPFYRASTTKGIPFNFTWFYVSYVGVKDLDGSIQAVPIYIDPKKTKTFKINEVRDAKLVLRIENISKGEYKVFSSTGATFRNTSKGFTTEYRLKGKSHLDYREWTFDLPVNKDIRHYTMFVEVQTKDGNIVMRTNRFSYTNNL